MAFAIYVPDAFWLARKLPLMDGRIRVGVTKPALEGLRRGSTIIEELCRQVCEDLVGGWIDDEGRFHSLFTQNECGDCEGLVR